MESLDGQMPMMTIKLAVIGPRHENSIVSCEFCELNISSIFPSVRIFGYSQIYFRYENENKNENNSFSFYKN